MVNIGLLVLPVGTLFAWLAATMGAIVLSVMVVTELDDDKIPADWQFWCENSQ